MSRDEAVRQLLREHVAAQTSVSEERRLTHVSTVLRFPPPPAHRGAGDGRLRLAPRLDAGLAESASRVSLRLPGQALSRGHRDYSARLLTDAITTAIARARPYVDDGLEGLPPLLHHREALGLWRLTVAATLTRAEQQELLVRDTGSAAEVLRDEDVAWHDPRRFAVARHLAVALLHSDCATAGRRMLWAQDEEFVLLRHDLERTDDHPLLHGLHAVGPDLQGRGGAAVWRANRKLALEGLARALVAGGSREMLVDPPGWVLRVPMQWQGYPYRHGDSLPARQQADLESGRVLQVRDGARSMLWPYDQAGAPIVGFADVLAAAGNLAAADFVELALLTADEIGMPPWVPVEVAADLGFVTDGEADRLIADAREWNADEVQAVLRRAQRLAPGLRDDLQAVATNTTQFARLARQYGLQCQVHRATWRWDIPGVGAALAQGYSAPRLRYLAEAICGTRGFSLEASMRQAADKAFWLGRPDADRM